MALQLVPDKGGRDALKCLIVAETLGVKVQLATDKAAGAFPERPLLLGPDELQLFSPLAICRYLGLASGTSRPEGLKLIGDVSSDKAALEDFLYWALFTLQPALDKPTSQAASEALESLEARLSGGGEYLFKTFTLADIFVWVAITRSRLPSLSSLPRLEAWNGRIAQLPAVQRAVQALQNIQTPTRPLAASAGAINGVALARRERRGGRYAITTAINYTNGPPHMGHAYEAVTSDVIARYHRIYGRRVFFLTGTDEHGQKIANTAEKMDKTPIEICDLYAQGFQDLNARLYVSNDFYVRTSSAKHKKVAQLVWEKAVEAGDIYLDNYEGWYNVREETFVTENEAKALDFKDPSTGLPLKRMQEPSYFFRMSKYHERLVQHIKSNPSFINPPIRRNEILARLEEGLADLSISRTTFSWGVEVPGAPGHVMYVWFDALTNYLSGMDWPDGANKDFWPANVHVIGKDIVWFHTVIWPCMLMSTGIPLPESVFAHGFVHAADGRKMSKSFGNVVDPNHLLDKYPADTFRFFLVREAKYGTDLPFSEDALIDHHNAVLADTLGNLVHRGVNLCKKNCDGKVPAVAPDMPSGAGPFDLDELKEETDRLMDEFCLQEALDAVVEACNKTNKYLQDRAPWAIKEADERAAVVRTVLEAVYVLAHFFEPTIPQAATRIFDKLNTPKKAIKDLSCAFDNLSPGTAVAVGEVLFEKLKVRTVDIPLQKVEIRVGEVKSVKPHPQADKLFVVNVQIGETDSDMRSVVSGVRDTFTAADLTGQRVVLICNMKPVNLRGEQSLGLLLATESSPGKSVLLQPGHPIGGDRDTAATSDNSTAESANGTVKGKDKSDSVPHVAVGSLVEAEGYPSILKGRENLTKKDVDALAQHFKVLHGVVVFQEFPLVINQGPGGCHVVAPGAPDGPLKIK
ncbi:unnamed protein product [Vitrella brassicaformis CCMP3155]|uniref:methionine--tRNA ligase n=2 Tax=Vitrella brassicaformis TaxID=1169539 RepID=A0A0G4EST7_VITBC|nr:unnamed protein product [Vitrella brassicaformis CCMP3155]|eukprot:CEM01471.1 unnamed protein product [Vitrella brassicaformis CCMP3155]